MVICLIGTRAQLIKMAPIMRELEARRFKYKLVFTGQHKATMAELLAEFKIAEAPEYIYRGEEITGIVQMGIWFLKVLARLGLQLKNYLPQSPPSQSVILVHGDTFSTLLGAVAGRICGIRVAHVEAGLRSFKLWHPFPEEITRLLVFRLCDIAFCPNAWALQNLAAYRMRKIDSGGNTLIDAVNYAIAQPAHPLGQCKEAEYGVISLHRFENIFDRGRFTRILSLIDLAARRMPVVFVLHPATRKKLEQFELLPRLLSNDRYLLRDRMSYVPFLQLLSRSRFVITDGGSNQEELSYLGIPTLLMRQATERTEGIGRNVKIANYDEQKVLKFLGELDTTTRGLAAVPSGAPSKTIIDHLEPYC